MSLLVNALGNKVAFEAPIRIQPALCLHHLRISYPTNILPNHVVSCTIPCFDRFPLIKPLAIDTEFVREKFPLVNANMH